MTLIAIVTAAAVSIVTMAFAAIATTIA